MLVDDPAFVPGLGLPSLPFEYQDNNGIPGDEYSLGQETISTPRNLSISRSISHLDNDDPQGRLDNRIVIPSSSSRGFGEPQFLPFDDADYPVNNDIGFLDDADFEFDENGDIQDILQPMAEDHDTQANNDMGPSDMQMRFEGAGPTTIKRHWDSESTASEQVRREHIQGLHDEVRMSCMLLTNLPRSLTRLVKINPAQSIRYEST